MKTLPDELKLRGRELLENLRDFASDVKKCGGMAMWDISLANEALGEFVSCYCQPANTPLDAVDKMRVDAMEEG